MNDINIKVVQFALNTSVGTQDITISGFGTPKAVLFYGTKAVTNDVAANNAMIFMGMSDLTTVTSGSFTSTNGQTFIQPSCIQSPTLVSAAGLQGVIDLSFSVVGAITDGVQINVTVAPPTAYLVNAVLINGADVGGVEAGWKTINTVNAIETVTLGFQPSVIFHAGNFSSTDDLPFANTSYGNFGVATNGDSLKNRSISTLSVSHVNTTDVKSLLSTEALTTKLVGGVIGSSVHVSEVTATGFGLSSDNLTGTNFLDISYLAIELLNFAKAEIVDVTHPNATGSAVTNIGFTPKSVMAFSAGTATADTLSTGDPALSISVFDDTTTLSTTMRSINGVTTTDDKSQVTTDLLVNGTTPTHRATVTSLDNFGYTLNYTTATTNIAGFSLAIGHVAGISITDVIWEPPTGWDYSIYSGGTIPTESILFYGEGSHDGLANASVLTDTTQAWTINEWVGFRIKNVSDGSTAVITANTANTITGVLAGGTENDWDIGDVYNIVADVASPDEIVYETTSTLSGSVSVDVLGVPIITGASGLHQFDYKVIDASDGLVSGISTVTIDTTTFSASWAINSNILIQD